MEKDKLKKLVNIFGDLLKIEGNDWLVDEILKTIGIKLQPQNDTSKFNIIQNIHEYCIEQKIEKQANEFYASFPIEALKSQLILDYKKMEHERRRDDFENFCLCVYQQIENITNFLFDSFIIDIWNDEKSNISIKSFYDFKQKKYTFPNSYGTTLEKLIFKYTKDLNDSKWYANRKFRAVLYFFYYSEDLSSDDSEFNKTYFIYEEICQLRNQNHRGGKNTDYQQNIIDKSKENKSRSYFKYYGFLEEFLSRIEKSIKEKWLNKTIFHTQNSFKNETLGDNPEFAKLIELNNKF